MVREHLEGSQDRENLSEICVDGAALEPAMGEILQKVRSMLSDATAIWEGFWKILQQPYTDERADKVAADLKILRVMFETVNRKLLQAMETAGKLSGKERP